MHAGRSHMYAIPALCSCMKACKAPSWYMSCITKVMDPSEPCTFLDLPPELRNYVYELAFSGTQASAHKGSSYTPPSVLLVNKQVYHETIPIFYAVAKFYLWYSSNVVEYSNAIKRHQNHITSFRVACEYCHVGKEEAVYEMYNAELRSQQINFKPGVFQIAISLNSNDLTWKNEFESLEEDTRQGVNALYVQSVPNQVRGIWYRRWNQNNIKNRLKHS